MTAVFCRAAADRKAETWAGASGPLQGARIRRLSRRRQGDHQGGLESGPGPPGPTPKRPTAGARPGPLPHRDGGPPRAGPGHWRRCRGGLGEGRGRRPHGCRPLQGTEAIDARGVARSRPGRPGAGATLLVRACPIASKRPGPGPARRWSTVRGRWPTQRPGSHAEAEIAGALEVNSMGPEWSKLRNYLKDPREPELPGPDEPPAGTRPRREAEWRQAMAWRWWLRHRRGGSSAVLASALIEGWWGASRSPV